MVWDFAACLRREPCPAFAVGEPPRLGGLDLGIHGLFEATDGFIDDFAGEVHFHRVGRDFVLDDQEFFLAEVFAFDRIGHDLVDIGFAILEALHEASDAFHFAAVGFVDFVESGGVGFVDLIDFGGLGDIADRFGFVGFLGRVELLDILGLLDLLGLKFLLEARDTLTSGLLGLLGLDVLHLLELLHRDLGRAAAHTGNRITHGGSPFTRIKIKDLPRGSIDEFVKKLCGSA